MEEALSPSSALLVPENYWNISELEEDQLLRLKGLTKCQVGYTVLKDLHTSLYQVKYQETCV